MIDLDNPVHVANELRRRGLPVFHADENIGTDARLREIFTAARLGGWTPDRPPRPRYINKGRLIAALRVSAETLESIKLGRGQRETGTGHQAAASTSARWTRDANP